MADASFPLAPTAIAVPTLALITLLIDAPAFVWYIKNRNLAASSLVFWVLTANFMNFLNPLIWPTDNFQSWWYGYVLCDIEVKLQVAMWFGVVGSLVCVMRNLASVLDTERTIMSPSPAQRRRQVAIDCLFCFGGPVYSMAVHYIVQPSRYYIFAISGCTSSFINSWPKLALIFIWPPILCFVAVHYSILVIIRMHRYRKNFSEVLVSANSNQTKTRFLRLFWLALALIVVVSPAQVYVLYQNSTVELVPYSWNEVHGPTWSDVLLVPSGGKVLFDRWIQIGAGYALFIFFGLGQDAKAMYRKWLLKIGLGRCFLCLHPNRNTQRQHCSTTSSRSRFFNKRISGGSFFSLHSRSVTTSTTTLSPEPFKGFDQLPTISETIRTATDSPISASTFSDEKQNPAMSAIRKMSWLDHFLVMTHLSASNRQRSAPPRERNVQGLRIFGTNAQGVGDHSRDPIAPSASI